jgi:hypothetical protein
MFRARKPLVEERSNFYRFDWRIVRLTERWYNYRDCDCREDTVDHAERFVHQLATLADDSVLRELHFH